MSDVEDQFERGYVAGLKAAMDAAERAPEPVYRLGELGKISAETHGQNVGAGIRTALRNAYNDAANRLQAREERK